MLVALLAIILLIISFFAKIPGGVKWASFVFLAVLLQWVFAIVSFEAPGLGLPARPQRLRDRWLGWRAAKQADVTETERPAPEAAVA